MRVLGALYDVTLIVSNGTPDASEPDATDTGTPLTGKRATRSSNLAVTGKSRPAASPKTRSAPKRKASQRSTPPSSPSNAEVRTWARQNGFTVKDRGRLPASVLAAYRNG